MAINKMKWMLRILPLVYIFIVWLQSSLFNPGSIEETPGLGSILELGHLIIFGVLYILIYFAWMTFGEVTPKMEAIIIIITLFCALGDEMHQYYVPYRSASLIDMVKNVMGIVVAWYVMRLVMKGRIKATRRI